MSGEGDTLSFYVILCLRACAGVYYYVFLQSKQSKTLTMKKKIYIPLLAFFALLGVTLIVFGVVMMNS